MLLTICFTPASPQNWETYYFSLGYLLTTPENKTNFNIHLDTFRGLLAIDESKELLEKELRVIQRLLTSTNNRLNKSSSLWHLYRQLYTLSLQFSRNFDHDYLSTFLESGDRHFSNYYCWNAAKWFFDIFTISQREALVKRTMEFCFRNFKDSSSWDALTYMICQSRRNLNHNIEEFHRLQYMLRSSKILTTQKYVEFRIEEILRDIVHLIDSFTVSEWSPFLCCLTIVFTFCELDTNFLSTAWKSDVEAFERSNGPVQIIRNNPVHSQEYTQDLVLRSTAAHICYKKRFLTMFIYMYNK